jgi:hypothetical protein
MGGMGVFNVLSYLLIPIYTQNDVHFDLTAVDSTYCIVSISSISIFRGGNVIPTVLRKQLYVHKIVQDNNNGLETKMISYSTSLFFLSLIWIVYTRQAIYKLV